MNSTSLEYNPSQKLETYLTFRHVGSRASSLLLYAGGRVQLPDPTTHKDKG